MTNEIIFVQCPQSLEKRLQPVVYISRLLLVQVESPELLREVLLTKKDTFSGRPHFVRMKAYIRFEEDIASGSDTPSWKLKKKAFNTSMKM